MNLATLTQNPLATAVATLLLFVALDSAAGVLVAIRAKTFDIHKLADFLGSAALPYVVPVMAAAVATPSDWTAARAGIVTAAGAAVVTLAADLRAKLAALVAGTLPKSGSAPIVGAVK